MFAGNTNLLTISGLQSVQELVGQEVLAIGLNQERVPITVGEAGAASLYTVVLHRGKIKITVRCSSDQLWVVVTPDGPRTLPTMALRTHSLIQSYQDAPWHILHAVETGPTETVFAVSAATAYALGCGALVE